MPRDASQNADLNPAIENVNSLTLAFAKAVGNAQADKNDNLVISPYNALTALAMVAKGADGNTREELARTLFGVGADELNAVVAQLAALNTDILAANKDQVTLSTANGVWANGEMMSLNEKYADDLKKIFGAEISAEAFSDPSIPGKINQWASDNTNGLIDKIVDRLSPADFAVLASALYFKGDWTNKFDTKETEKRPFTLDDKSLSLTPTMHKTFKKGEVTYQDGADYEAVGLTYGEKNREEGKSPTMRVVLIRPKDAGVSARDWLSQQTGTPAWLEAGSFENVRGTVELPQIDIKQRHDLIPALKEMGIRDAFNGGAADFTPMTDNGAPLVVSGVSHDVVFKTDEKGSEAAAVTTVTMTRSASIEPPVREIDVKFDRSFVFALQDIKTGAVIFAGAVNKPNDDMKKVFRMCPPSNSVPEPQG